MPDGTVSQETYRRELKTLPGGFVELRQLPYHDMLVRRDKGSIASMEQQQTAKKRGQELPAKLMIESLQTWERDYMFKNCIKDHNITDKEGVLLDFNSPMALKMLRPDIGMEIERYIDDLNSEGDVGEDFPIAPTSSTEQVKPELSMLPNTDMSPTSQKK